MPIEVSKSSIIAYGKNGKNITFEELAKNLYCVNDVLGGRRLAEGAELECKSVETESGFCTSEKLRIRFENGDIMFIHNNLTEMDEHRFGRIGDVCIFYTSVETDSCEEFRGYGVGLAKRRVENFDEEFEKILNSYLKK